ncbi:L-aspartate oxidase [Rathayibacter sp. CAU 1779]
MSVATLPGGPDAFVRRPDAAPRVLLVGSGIAGLTAALRLSAIAEVTLLTKGGLEESNTLYAQGGIAAALFDDDSPELHVADTLAAGAGLGDAEAVRILCTEGPERVRELLRFGVPFDRENGRLARGLEAAHSRSRVLHAGGDATGRAIEVTLATRVRASGIRIVQHAMLTDLVVDDGRVIGARTLDADGRRSTIAAEAVVLATGGAGRLFSHTTNPAVATGDGVAAAWRAGAELADLEFYQFHPTALAVPGGTLVSEAVRGEGAVLRDAEGVRFMERVHPLAELAPRDVVARGIARRMAAQDGAPVFLDATRLGRAFLARRFPTIQAACDAAGFDWASEPVPVTPAAHYWMGGVRTDAWGRASLPGLYAIGEAACTGAQGANRLASNSLLEGLVFAARATEAIGAADLPVSPLVDASEIASTSHRPGTDDASRAAAGGPSAGERIDRAADERRDTGDLVRELLWEGAGVERDGDGLRAAAFVLERLGARADGEGNGSPRSIAEQENSNLVSLGALLVRSAMSREESRGAHFRSDFPETSGTPEHTIVTNRFGEPVLWRSSRLAGAGSGTTDRDHTTSAREGLIREVVATC